MSLQGEIKALVKVTAWVIISMTYARHASSRIRSGKPRLLSLLPIILLLLHLPWSFASVNLRGGFAFLLAWLAVFKLLLLSFGVGSLSPSLPLPTFIATSSLPVKLALSRSESPSSSILATSCIKTLLLALLFPLYSYKSAINSYLLLVIYSLHIYLILEIALSITGFLASSLGLDIEPQFNAPLKSESLQDFWGRRWNLMVTSILRPSVYYPVRSRFGTIAGVMAAFLGLSTVAEVTARGWVVEADASGGGRWTTLGFVLLTSFWLFFPPFLRGEAEENWLQEYMEVARLVEVRGEAMLRRLTG
ncbi:probable long-chain-alcohol O-fatty-acyltransferase 4 isoform X2 [Asparagus officinalis]|uniref:probable long-chain-alcohol O-fatty-acyltransferase 4 isoform X2 n=1 Tax=Asparagus officinalis TaxID=4686 RepID=UPI00098E0040|nr:probable long-chain-alcohol O-fatty-acyltransferase 4 isoform X2 [Asparagus officinalis]